MSNIEIERKFLVRDLSFREKAVGSRHLIQGYISKEKGHTVRVRLDDSQAWLTIKGAGSASGMSRSEWEWEIPARDALGLLQLCRGGVIDKTRYLVPVFEEACFEAEAAVADEGVVLDEGLDSGKGTVSEERVVSDGGVVFSEGMVSGEGTVSGDGKGRFWEVDVFHGANEGLVVAEIELTSENENFPVPDWIGEEVTGDRKYYNSMLSVHPFCEW